MRLLKDEGGNILVLTALSFTLLVSFLAFAVDIGNLYYTQRQLQTLADSAAMAGALEIAACGATPSSSCGVMQTAATTALTEGGNPSPTVFLQCAAASGTGLLLTLNNGPCALGGSDPNSGNTNYVEVVVTKNISTYFAGLVGFKKFQVSARAEAGHSVPSSNACLNTNSLTLNSNAKITDGSGSTCGINDNDSGTLNLNSGVTVNVGSFTVHGSVNTANCGTCTSYTPLPKGGSPMVPDPFSSLAQPSQPSTSTTNTGTIGGTTTLQPGYYSSTINFNSGSGPYTVTLSPGLYYFGGGFNADTNVTIQGSGVTLFFAPGANVNMNSSATFDLTAPAAGLSNCASCAGMVIWQPSGNLTLDASSSSSWGGAVYVPNGTLTLNGGSTATAYGMVQAQTVMVESAISISCATMPGGVCPGGGGAGAGNGSQVIALAE